MESNRLELLLVEDNALHVRLMQAMLQHAWTNEPIYTHVDSVQAAVLALSHRRPDCVLLDLVVSDATGLEGLDTLRQVAPQLPIVVVSSTSDEEVAIEAIRRGAQDFLVKGDVTAEALYRSIRFAIERARYNTTHTAPTRPAPTRPTLRPVS